MSTSDVPEQLRAIASIVEAKDLKVDFPSSAHGKLDKVYDAFSKYAQKVKRSPDKKLANHKKLVNEAMDAFVSLKAKLKRAEESLY